MKMFPTLLFGGGSGGGGGVSSLNGKTGALTLASSDGSVTVTSGGATTVNVSVAGGRTATTTPVTMVNTDRVVGINLAAPGAVAVAGASGRTAYKPYTIKDQKGDAGTNNITYTPNSGTINGAASILIQQNYDSLTIYSDGTNEFTI